MNNNLVGHNYTNANCYASSLKTKFECLVNLKLPASSHMYIMQLILKNYVKLDKQGGMLIAYCNVNLNKTFTDNIASIVVLLCYTSFGLCMSPFCMYLQMKIIQHKKAYSWVTKYMAQFPAGNHGNILS